MHRLSQRIGRATRRRIKTDLTCNIKLLRKRRSERQDPVVFSLGSLHIDVNYINPNELISGEATVN
jgi:hypothetical protein